MEGYPYTHVPLHVFVIYGVICAAVFLGVFAPAYWVNTGAVLSRSAWVLCWFLAIDSITIGSDWVFTLSVMGASYMLLWVRSTPIVYLMLTRRNLGRRYFHVNSAIHGFLQVLLVTITAPSAFVPSHVDQFLNLTLPLNSLVSLEGFRQPYMLFCGVLYVGYWVLVWWHWKQNQNKQINYYSFGRSHLHSFIEYRSGKQMTLHRALQLNFFFDPLLLGAATVGAFFISYHLLGTLFLFVWLATLTLYQFCFSNFTMHEFRDTIFNNVVFAHYEQLRKPRSEIDRRLGRFE